MSVTPSKDTDYSSDDSPHTKNTVEESFPSDSQLLQSVLGGDITNRVKAYSTIIKKCSQKKTPDFKWSLLKKPDLEQVVSLLLGDLQSDPTVEVMQNAVGMVGYIMSKPEFTKVLPVSSVRSVAQSLLYIAKKEKDKKIVVRVLWGFAMEKYPATIYEQYCDELVDIIIDALSDQESSVVVYESLRLLLFLIKSVGALVVEKAVDFYPEVFPHLFHLAPKIRKLALNCTNLLLEQPDSLEVLSGIVKTAIPKIKTQYAKVLFNLVSENCVDALIIWQVCIRMLDRQLHSGTTLINPLLSVIEKGFKSSESLIRVESFNCWHCLINNFALEESVLTSIKRLRLLVAPFTANNAKNEDIASAKLNAWWRLITAVGSAAVQHFDLLVSPLLVFCFKFTPVSSVSPKVAGLAAKNLTMAGASSPGRMYTGMQSKLTHVFYQLLVSGEDGEANLLKGCSLDKLKNPVILLAQYTKHHELLHTCFREVLYNIASEGGSERVAYRLAQHLMKLLGEYVSSSNVKDGAEAVRQMFAVVSEAAASECAMQSNIVRGAVVLEVMAAALCGEMALPASMLSSRHYQAGSLGAGDLMRGTLASSLADMLLQPPLLLASSANRSSFLEIWNSVLQSCKSDGVGRLAFVQGVCSSLSCSITANGADSSNGGGDGPLLGGCGGTKSIASFFASLWMALISSLRFHINKTQTVDQGDNAEHDFGCMYTALTLPLQHCNVILKDLPQDELRILMEEWKLTYSMFVNLAPLSPAAPANEEADHLARQITCLLRSDQLAGPPDLHCNTLTFVSGVLACIGTHFRYTQLAVPTAKGVMSPGKPRKKNNPLLELQSLVDGTLEAWGRVLRLVGLERRQPAAALTKVLHDMLSGVKLPKMLPLLLTALMDSMTAILEVNPAARYGSEVELKVLSVYDMYCTLLEEHLLARPLNDIVAPKFLALIQNGVTSTNGRVSARSRKLWQSADHSRLAIPVQLQSALSELSETSLTPPSAPFEDNRNTTASPAAKGGRPVVGSFLNKGRVSNAASPAAPPTSAPRTPSNVKTTKPKAATSLLAMDDAEFVKISSPTSNKKRILTPHQREKLQERRCDIPALYSDLSQQYSQSILASQDMFPPDKEICKDSRKSHFKGEFSGRKSFTGTASFPDMDGIEVMKEDAEIPANNASGDIAEVHSDADEKNESKNIEDHDLSPSQLDFVDRIAKLRNSQKKDESNEVELNNEKKQLTNDIHEDEDSEDEIPNSQVTDVAGPTKRVSAIFSSRTAEVLHNYSSPRAISVSPANHPSSHTPQTKRQRAAEEVQTVPEFFSKKRRGSADELSVGHTEDAAIDVPAEGSKNIVVVVEDMETSEKDQLPSIIKRTPSKGKRKLSSDDGTPGKVTRSGRMVVAPRKGMPKQMTPPGAASSKKIIHRPLPGASEVSRLNSSELDSDAPSTTSVGSKKNPPASKSFQKTIREMFQQTQTVLDGVKEGANAGNETEEEIISEVHKEKNPSFYSRKNRSSGSSSDDSVFDSLLKASDKSLLENPNDSATAKPSNEDGSKSNDKHDPPPSNEKCPLANLGKGKSIKSRTKRRGKSSESEDVESVVLERQQTSSLIDETEDNDFSSSNGNATSITDSEINNSTRSVVVDVPPSQPVATADRSGDQCPLKGSVEKTALASFKSCAILLKDSDNEVIDTSIPEHDLEKSLCKSLFKSPVKISDATKENKSVTAANTEKADRITKSSLTRRLESNLIGVETVSGPRRTSRALKKIESRSTENCCDATDLTSSITIDAGNAVAVHLVEPEISSHSASLSENDRREQPSTSPVEIDGTEAPAISAEECEQTNNPHTESKRKKDKIFDVDQSNKCDINEDSNSNSSGNVNDVKLVQTFETPTDLIDVEGITFENQKNVTDKENIGRDVSKDVSPGLRKMSRESPTAKEANYDVSEAVSSSPVARTRGRKRKLEDNNEQPAATTKRRNTRSQQPLTSVQSNDSMPRRPGRPSKKKAEQESTSGVATTGGEKEGGKFVDEVKINVQHNLEDDSEVSSVKKSENQEFTSSEFRSPVKKCKITGRKTRSPKTTAQCQKQNNHFILQAGVELSVVDKNESQTASNSSNIAEEERLIEGCSQEHRSRVDDTASKCSGTDDSNEDIADVVVTETDGTRVNESSNIKDSETHEGGAENDNDEYCKPIRASNRDHESVLEKKISLQNVTVTLENSGVNETSKDNLTVMDCSVDNRDALASKSADDRVTSARTVEPATEEETVVDFVDSSCANDILSSTPDEADESVPMETYFEDTVTAEATRIQEKAPNSSADSGSLNTTMDSTDSNCFVTIDERVKSDDKPTMKPLSKVQDASYEDTSDLSITTTDSIDDSPSSPSTSASTAVSITPPDVDDVSGVIASIDCNSPCIAALPSSGNTSSVSVSLLSPCVTPSTSDRRKGGSLGSGALRGGTSRAALMVACAQRNRQQNTAGPKGTPARLTPGRPRQSLPSVDDASLACDLLDSPSRRSFSGSASADSPASTPPPIRRTRLIDPTGSERPWAKHHPSPAASPSNSILKRPLVDSCSKGRRVSFADPPVSESVVIPNDTLHHTTLQPQKSSGSLSLRAQKRLDMSRAIPPASPSPLRVPASGAPAIPSKLTKLVDPATLPQQPSQKSLAMLVTSDCPSGSDSESEAELDNLSCSQGIYSSLSGCSEPVTALLPQLTSPALTASLKAVLLNRGLTTVGHLANLTESDVTSLPIKPPKLEVMVKVLKQFDEAISKKASIDTEPTPAVEQPDEPMEDYVTVHSDSAEPATSTSEENLSDKENQSPPPTRDGSGAKSITAEESTSTSDPPSKMKPTENLKLFKRNLEPSAIREVLAEIPIGLDAEESDDDDDSDNLPLSALKNRVRGIADKALSKVEASTSGTQAGQLDQQDERTESVKTVQSVDLTCANSENGSTKGDKLGPTDSEANKKAEPADDELDGRVATPTIQATSGDSVTEDQILECFRNIPEESRKATLISQCLAAMNYKTVVKVFSEYLSNRD